jgi:LPS-assembly lipoprotein
MSLPRKGAVGALSRTIRSAAVCGLIGVSAIGLSGCGFQPLYGPTASGEQLSDVMKTVDINTVPGRVGQRIRNELIFRTTGGGYAEAPKYRLEIAVRESLQKTLVNQEGDALGEIYQLYSEYKLVRIADRKVVLEGHTNARSAFDRADSVFASTRAKRDAEDRAARTIAESIRTRLASFLSQAA